MTRQKVFLPNIRRDNQVSGQNSDEDILFFILKNMPEQKRSEMIRHPLLDAAAKFKADDLARKNYFAHTSPEGVGANQNVRNIGYFLPSEYLPEKNNVESLSIGGGSPKETADGWLGSAKHRPHVFGENNFFRGQQCIGIGKAISQDKRPIYVYISAPCA